MNPDKDEFIGVKTLTEQCKSEIFKVNEKLVSIGKMMENFKSVAIDKIE